MFIHGLIALLVLSASVIGEYELIMNIHPIPDPMIRSAYIIALIAVIPVGIGSLGALLTSFGYKRSGATFSARDNWYGKWLGISAKRSKSFCGTSFNVGLNATALFFLCAVLAFTAFSIIDIAHDIYAHGLPSLAGTKMAFTIAGGAVGGIVLVFAVVMGIRRFAKAISGTAICPIKVDNE